MRLKPIKILMILIFTLWAFGVNAQVQVHKELRTPTWNLIGLRYEKQVKPLVFKTIFPEALMAINNKTVELPGFIIPTKVGNKFSTFMLSIVPIESCPFCGSGDIPSMIEVKMIKPIEWTDKPVKIRGKLLINNTGDKRSEFFLLDAEKL